MVIHTQIQVTGYKDQTIAAAVYFYDSSRALVPVGAAATEENTDANGWLRSRVEMTPGFDSTVWDDVSFFVPYAAFPDGLTGEVTFSAEADVFDGTNWISPSEWTDFVITYSGNTAPGNTSLEGSATTSILQIEHNSEQNGQNGMLIHVSAEVLGYKDVPVIAGVFFYDSEGRLVEATAGAAEEFVASNGLLRVRMDLTPGFDDTIYDDLQLWIPYSAFPAGTGEVSFFAEADIYDGSNWISPSSQMELIITYGSSSSSTTTTTTQQTSTGGGITASCGDVTISNGVEIIVRQMRPGFTYTATAIGIGDFDPVLIVRDTVNPNDALCNDDADDAAKYTVNLPTTGVVAASPRSSQLFFNHSNANMTDISLIVGDYSGNAGEFVLVLESMAVTSADGAGDPFTVDVNPSVIGATVPLAVYMIGAETQLDPLLQLTDNSLSPWLDTEGIAINCDDGGTNTCWGQSADLSTSTVTRGSSGILRADARDSMLVLPVQDVSPQPMTFLMSSYNRQTTGLYAIAFHMGLS
jgi:hypothetical protein